MTDRLTMTSDKGGVAFTFDLDITCEKSEIIKILKVAEKLKAYEEIGTVEECREAREKQIAKKPDKRTDKHTDLIQYYWCPVCGRYFGQAGIYSALLLDKPKYCTCGQAIDWTE